jgi:hypothetical protein
MGFYLDGNKNRQRIDVGRERLVFFVKAVWL